MAVDIPGLICVIVFYVIVLVIGIVAGRKTAKSNTTEETFVANRSIGMWLSYFTLSATNIGGGYINGTAEAIAFSGLIWTNAPILYSVSIMIAGYFYAPKMRRGGYVTMFDPIQIKLGKRIGALLFFPDLLGDVFWTAAILAALGSTMALILDLDANVSIIVSACIAIFYTLLGGLYSVAYTDVIQLLCLVVGLLLSFPFAFYHPSVNLESLNDTWVGEISQASAGTYADMCLQLLCGALSWQAYYLRVLACKTPRIARVSSILAAITSLIMALPPAAIGIVGAATGVSIYCCMTQDWNATDYAGPIPIPKEQHSFILPMVLKFLCPRPVAVVGIGAVAAAVMSSADSAVLAAGTVFAKNIYKDIFRPKASEREIMWVMRAGVLLSGILSCLIAILVKSVYGLFYLCSDLMYVILFPQLTCILWVKFTNGYGSVSAYAASLFLRIASGDALLQIPALIKFPYYSEEDGQLFPFRTLCMAVNFIVLISVSWITKRAFMSGWLPKRCDFLRIVKNNQDPVEKGPNEKLMTEFHGSHVRIRHKEEKEEEEKSFTE